MKNKLTLSFPITGAQFHASIQEDGSIWFYTKPCCDILGLPNSSQAIKSLDDDEKGVTISDTLGGRQTVSIISESGLYALILKSRKPEAKAFRRWITGEVIPQLMRTGRYEPDATEGERFALEHRRLVTDRAAAKISGLAALDGSGLLTIRAYRQMHPIHEVLRFSAALQAAARRAGYAPERFYTTSVSSFSAACPLLLRAGGFVKIFRSSYGIFRRMSLG